MNITGVLVHPVLNRPNNWKDKLVIIHSKERLLGLITIKVTITDQRANITMLETPANYAARTLG